MKYFSFALTSLITLALIYTLDRRIPMGDTAIPPLGKFLNPFTGFWQNAESANDPGDRTLRFDDVSGPVQVDFDERGVPHVFAGSIEDALFAQGYLHARDRLWQMDFSTRAAGGRLAEILGPDLVDFDLRRRRIGMVYAAENAVKGWKKFPREYQQLERYVDGVNAYINQLQAKDYPIEFKLIDYEVEPWTVLKSALFFKAMALTLCSQEDDLEATNMRAHFGQETFDFLFPEYFDAQSPVIPEDSTWDFEAMHAESPQVVDSLPAYGLRTLDRLPKGIGSNNWAVSGRKTKSGKTMLCSDPHLKLTLPSIWYECHLNTPQMNVYGASLPSMPGIIIGFNEHIAWAMTNVGQDVLDWMRISWTDETRTTYTLDGETRKASVHIDTFFVRGGQAVVDTVKYTHWGPVSFERGDYKDLALRWLAHDVPDKSEFTVFVRINQCRDFECFDRVSDEYLTPAQNFVFAAGSGDIAMKVNGRFPMKAQQSGRFVLDGSQTNGGWQSFIPRAHNPRSVNPARGFVASANQHSTAPSYPYYYNGGFEEFRGRYLNEQLAQMQDIGIEDMQALQYNSESVKARDALPFLLASVESIIESELEKSIISELSKWNHRYDGNSKAATYFNRWFNDFFKKTWDEIAALREDMIVLYPEEWRLIELAAADPQHTFFDHADSPEIESARDIARLSFKAMVEWVEERQAEGKPEEWGAARRMAINHIANVPAFSAGQVNVPGHGNVLNASNGTHGPSWRMVVHFTDPIEAYGVIPGGQSGNPGSPLYMTGLNHWKDGSYFRLHFPSSPGELRSPLSTLTFTNEN